MDARKLDREVTIQRTTETRDEFNNPVQSWSDLATVWGAKQDVSDRERIAAQEVGAEITTRFQIRYRADLADINPRDRLVCEGRIYGIVAAKELPYRAGIEITATARAE